MDKLGVNKISENNKIKKEFWYMKVELLNLENVKNAFAIANNSIYFADKSDYKTALYEVCKTLNPNIKEELIGSEYIEEDIKEAENKSIIYEYLIIYEMQNLKGRCKVDRTKLIEGIEDIEGVEQYLRTCKEVAPEVPYYIKNKLIVIDFKLLRTIN